MGQRQENQSKPVPAVLENHEGAGGNVATADVAARSAAHQNAGVAAPDSLSQHGGSNPFRSALGAIQHALFPNKPEIFEFHIEQGDDPARHHKVTKLDGMEITPDGRFRVGSQEHDLPHKKGFSCEVVGITSDGIVCGNFRAVKPNIFETYKNTVPFLLSFDEQGRSSLTENPKRQIYTAANEGGPREYEVSEFLGMGTKGDTLIAKTPNYRGYGEDEGYARLVIGTPR